MNSGAFDSRLMQPGYTHAYGPFVSSGDSRLHELRRQMDFRIDHTQRNLDQVRRDRVDREQEQSRRKAADPVDLEKELEKLLKCCGGQLIRRPAPPSVSTHLRGMKRSFSALSDAAMSERRNRYQDKVQLTTKRSTVQSADWSHDGQMLIVVTNDGLRLVKAEGALKEEKSFSGDYVAAAMDPSDNLSFACIQYDGNFKMFDKEKLDSIFCADLKNVKKEICDMTNFVWSPKGNCGAVCTKLDLVCIFSLTRGDSSSKSPKMRVLSREVVPGDDKEVTCMVFDLKGNYLWIGCSGSPGKIWRREANSESPTSQCINAHLGDVKCLAADPMGKYIVSGGQDGVINLWDQETGYQVGAFTRAETAITSVSLNFDASLLAWTNGTNSGTGDKRVYIAHTETRRLLWADEQRGPATFVKFAPKSNKLVYFYYEEEDRERVMDRFSRAQSTSSYQYANFITIPDRNT